MRVVSGTFSSRKLFGFDIVGIRPTKDRVKESIFAMIYSKLIDSVCLDLFAGTGSLGIEAISNGANHVYFSDINREAITAIKSNVDTLNINDKCTVINDNYTNVIKKFNDNNTHFDIIFIDPPYGKIKIIEVINLLLKNDILNDNGIIVCEYEDETLNEEYEYLKLIKIKRYGRTFVSIYKK
jgi:16S rRNA (guanine(966)-N(2))-methyltransferase RsmD